MMSRPINGRLQRLLRILAQVVSPKGPSLGEQRGAEEGLCIRGRRVGARVGL
jgi:hypothetical protein